MCMCKLPKRIKQLEEELKTLQGNNDIWQKIREELKDIKSSEKILERISIETIEIEKIKGETARSESRSCAIKWCAVAMAVAIVFCYAISRSTAQLDTEQIKSLSTNIKNLTCAVEKTANKVPCKPAN